MRVLIVLVVMLGIVFGQLTGSESSGGGITLPETQAPTDAAGPAPTDAPTGPDQDFDDVCEQLGNCDGPQPTPAPDAPTDAPTPADTPAPAPVPTPTDPVAAGGATEINFDFKGILAGAQGGDCNCAKKTQCDQCLYGIFGYPCVADHCSQCKCGGGLAVPPGSACFPCEEPKCVDGPANNCLFGRDGLPCEPDLQIRRYAASFGSFPSPLSRQLFIEITMVQKYSPTFGGQTWWAAVLGTTEYISNFQVVALNSIPLTNGQLPNINDPSTRLDVDANWSFDGVSGQIVRQDTTFNAGNNPREVFWYASGNGPSLTFNAADADFPTFVGLQICAIPQDANAAPGSAWDPAVFDRVRDPDNADCIWLRLPARQSFDINAGASTNLKKRNAEAQCTNENDGQLEDQGCLAGGSISLN